MLGAVRKAVAPRWNGLAKRAKGRELARILRALLVGRGEVAEQGLDREAIQRATHRLGGGQSQPVHPRIDHHVARAPFPGMAPARDLFDAVEHRTRRQHTRRHHVGLADAVEHRQRYPPGQRHQRRGLGPGRDEEETASGVGEMVHDRTRAKAIAIGLDRRAAGRRAARPSQPAPVGNERLPVEAKAERSGDLDHPPPLAAKTRSANGGDQPAGDALPHCPSTGSFSMKAAIRKATRTTPQVYHSPA